MFRVRNATTGEILPGNPSPMLIGLSGVNDAYDAGTPEHPFWRVRDDAYDASNAPGVVYTKVRVEQLDNWRVDVDVEIVDPSYHETDDDLVAPYRDYFIVQAADRREAEDLASEAARVAARRQYGDVGTSVSFIRTQKGVSI